MKETIQILSIVWPVVLLMGIIAIPVLSWLFKDKKKDQKPNNISLEEKERPFAASSPQLCISCSSNYTSNYEGICLTCRFSK